MTDSTADQRATDSLDSDWVRPVPSGRGYRTDAWAALALLAGTAVSVTLTRVAGIFDESPTWLVVVWVAAITLPLAVRRRWPELVGVVIAVVFSGGAMLGSMDLLFANICLYVAIYSVGAWSRNRTRAAWVRALIIVGMFIWLFWNLLISANQVTAMPDLSRDGFFSPFAAYGLLQVLINLLYFSAAYYFGDTAWRAARQAAALTARTQELADERQLSAAQAVTLERVRIARELHDVVAHHVSVMGVQAGAARRILTRDPEQATLALEAIERSARTAVDELHTMLGTLRSVEGDDANSATSTRGIAQLAELAAECSAAGLPVALTMVGEPREVPKTIELCVYRIAQEALTNTRKHAGAGVRADLRLRYEADAIELELTDDGSGAVRAGSSGSGRGPGSDPANTSTNDARDGLGHLGMRERVAAVGGELELGPRPRGGYLVRARFPTHRAAAVDAANTAEAAVQAAVVPAATADSAANASTVTAPGGLS